MRVCAVVYVQIPEEFQDPLMAELMEDPVQLPSSGYIMDRAQVWVVCVCVCVCAQ